MSNSPIPTLLTVRTPVAHEIYGGKEQKNSLGHLIHIRLVSNWSGNKKSNYFFKKTFLDQMTENGSKWHLKI